METQELRSFAGKGQSLVEYALILVLAVVVVIIVFALLGPSIGRTYSNVVANLGGVSSPTQPPSAPTAVPTVVPTLDPGWTFCSNEYSYCSFGGTMRVQYGANGTYTERMLTGGTMCENAVFGDPLYGVLKHCNIHAP
jgi:Flp pilus assembly pilin Flp